MTAEREKTEPRIGVYICHCGMNIAATVDVEMVRDYAGTLPRVVLARDHRYTCSELFTDCIAERYDYSFQYLCDPRRSNRNRSCQCDSRGN